MARIHKHHDPDQTRRAFTFIITEQNCPGLLHFLAELPFRAESALVRGVVYQWFRQHLENGTLDEAAQEVLAGPGGEITAPAIKTPVLTPRRRGRKPLSPSRLPPAAPATKPAPANPTPRALAVVPPPAPATPPDGPMLSLVDGEPLVADASLVSALPGMFG